MPTERWRLHHGHWATLLHPIPRHTNNLLVSGRCGPVVSKCGYTRCTLPARSMYYCRKVWNFAPKRKVISHSSSRDYLDPGEANDLTYCKNRSKAKRGTVFELLYFHVGAWFINRSIYCARYVPYTCAASQNPCRTFTYGRASNHETRLESIDSKRLPAVDATRAYL